MNDKKTVKAVIYDGDGMVINSEVFYLQVLKEFGSKAEVLNDFYANEFQLCLIGKADLKEELVPYLIKLGWSKGVDEFVKYWFECEEKVDANILSSIIKIKSKGIKCYLASNQEKYRTEFVLGRLEFETVFDKIFFSSQIGYLKPQAEFFEYIDHELESLGIAKDEILFWDDREKNVSIAREYGFQAETYKNVEDYQNMIKQYGLL
jgi:putative hydrolase of the HAD superfamily